MRHWPPYAGDVSGLRVAIFSDAMPERNGAGAYYNDLCRQIEPHVAAVERFEPVVKPRMRLALPLPGDSTQKLLTPNVPRLWKQLKALRPHIVVSVTPGPFGILGVYLARRYGAGFLTGFHTHFEELARLYFNPVVFWGMNQYLVAMNKVLCRSSPTVLINNSNLEATVRKLGARQTDIIGTPLAPAFRNSPLKNPVGALKTVLFAGRLAPEKNLPAVVAAAKALPSVQFLIAGDGPLRKWLDTELAGLANVEKLGWLQRPQLLEAMQRADLLLLPSRMETFGTVALESMACGRPAMVAEGAGIHDWPQLAEGLIPIPEGQTVADCLQPWLNGDPQAFAAKGQAAREAAFRLNDWTIEHWLELLQRHAADVLSA